MKTKLEAWNGKSTGYLRDVYELGFDFDLSLMLCDDPACSDAASWLVKHHCEISVLSFVQVQRVLNAQRAAGTWPTLLHLVQALDKVDFTGCDVSHAARVTCELSDHKAPFVRAWAISAFAKISTEDDHYRLEAQKRVMNALEGDEKPSVLARLRKAAKYLDQS